MREGERDARCAGEVAVARETNEGELAAVMNLVQDEESASKRVNGKGVIGGAVVVAAVEVDVCGGGGGGAGDELVRSRFAAIGKPFKSILF